MASMVSPDVFFTSAIKFDFVADNGKRITGVSVRFISGSEVMNSDTQIGSPLEKMSMPIDQWDDLKALNLKTFDRIKLVINGFGRNARLVRVERAEDND